MQDLVINISSKINKKEIEGEIDKVNCLIKKLELVLLKYIQSIIQCITSMNVLSYLSYVIKEILYYTKDILYFEKLLKILIYNDNNNLLNPNFELTFINDMKNTKETEVKKYKVQILLNFKIHLMMSIFNVLNKSNQTIKLNLMINKMLINKLESQSKNSEKTEESTSSLFNLGIILLGFVGRIDINRYGELILNSNFKSNHSQQLNSLALHNPFSRKNDCKCYDFNTFNNNISTIILNQTDDKILSIDNSYETLKPSSNKKSVKKIESSKLLINKSLVEIILKSNFVLNDINNNSVDLKSNFSPFLPINHTFIYNFLINTLTQDETNLYICELILEILNKHLKNVYFFYGLSLETLIYSIIAVSDIKKYLSKPTFLNSFLEIVFTISSFFGKREKSIFFQPISNEETYDKFFSFIMNAIKSILHSIKLNPGQTSLGFSTFLSGFNSEKNDKNEKNQENTSDENPIIKSYIEQKLSQLGIEPQFIYLKYFLSILNNFLSSSFTIYSLESSNKLLKNNKKQIKKLNEWINTIFESLVDMRRIAGFSIDLCINIFNFIFNIRDLLRIVGDDVLLIKFVFLIFSTVWFDYEGELYKAITEIFNIKIKRFVKLELNDLIYCNYFCNSKNKSIFIRDLLILKISYLNYLGDNLLCYLSLYIANNAFNQTLMSILKKNMTNSREKILLELLKWNSNFKSINKISYQCDEESNNINTLNNSANIVINKSKINNNAFLNNSKFTNFQTKRDNYTEQMKYKFSDINPIYISGQNLISITPFTSGIFRVLIRNVVSNFFFSIKLENEEEIKLDNSKRFEEINNILNFNHIDKSNKSFNKSQLFDLKSKNNKSEIALNRHSVSSISGSQIKKNKSLKDDCSKYKTLEDNRNSNISENNKCRDKSTNSNISKNEKVTKFDSFNSSDIKKTEIANKSNIQKFKKNEEFCFTFKEGRIEENENIDGYNVDEAKLEEEINDSDINNSFDSNSNIKSISENANLDFLFSNIIFKQFLSLITDEKALIYEINNKTGFKDKLLSLDSTSVYNVFNISVLYYPSLSKKFIL